MSNDPNILEVVKRGAELISGAARDTEKAAPVDDTEKAVPTTEDTEKGELPEAFKKDADKDADKKEEKDTEKAMVAGQVLVAAHETPEFAQAVERAVEKALAPLLALLPKFENVEKGLGAIDEKVTVSLQHQAATTDVITGLKASQDTVRDVVKSVKNEVETIGNQPAGRKSLDVEQETVRETEKALEQKVEIDLDKLREVTKSMETHQMLTVMKAARKGDVNAVKARLTPAQIRAADL